MKRLRRPALLIIILIVVFFVIRFFLTTITKDSLITYVELKKPNTSDILSVISGIASIILTSVFDYIFKRWELQANIQQKVPYISISAVRAQSVTGKRRKRSAPFIEVELGKPQQEFRYVYAKIMNAGPTAIVNCIIVKKNIPYQLNPQIEYPISFLIYEPRKQKLHRKYAFTYVIEDGKGNKYKGKYTLEIDLSKREAIFHVKRKQKEV